MSDSSNSLGSLGLAFIAAGLYTSLQSNKAQASIERANIKMQASQAGVKAAEEAYQRSRTFRQNVASQLAMGGMGFGGTMGAIAAQNESLANVNYDLAAIDKQQQFTQLAKQSGLTSSRINKYARDVQAFGAAAKQTSDLASKLGLFSGGG